MKTDTYGTSFEIQSAQATPKNLRSALLDQIAEARRERDAAAVEFCEAFDGVDSVWSRTYRAARARFAALEAKLEQGKDSP